MVVWEKRDGGGLVWGLVRGGSMRVDKIARKISEVCRHPLGLVGIHRPGLKGTTAKDTKVAILYHPSCFNR